MIKLNMLLALVRTSHYLLCESVGGRDLDSELHLNVYSLTTKASFTYITKITSMKRPASKLELPSTSPMGRNAAQGVMDHLKKLEKKGRPGPLQAYKACKTWEDKRKFALQLMVDKECAFLSVEEKKETTKVDEVNKSSGWCYLWDVARINGMSFDPGNEKQMRMLKSLVSSCETKGSEDDELAIDGWKLYKYSKEFESKEKFKKARKIGLRAEANMEDVGECKNTEELMENNGKHMFDIGGDLPTKKGAKKPHERFERRTSMTKMPDMPCDENDMKSNQNYVKGLLAVVNNLVLEMKSNCAILASNQAKKQIWWSEKLFRDVDAHKNDICSWQMEIHKVDVMFLINNDDADIKEAIVGLKENVPKLVEACIDFNSRVKQLADTLK